MSGVINAPTSGEKTLALYQEASKDIAMTGVPVTAAGTGEGHNNTMSGSPSGSGPSPTGLPDVATNPPNSGSALVGASSAFALIAAAVVAALAL